MGAVIDIALSKLIYWYDAPRIQTWPALLAKVEPKAEFTSLTAFGRTVTSERITDQGHLADHDYVRNFPGLEIKSNRLVLRGVGMLELENKKYRLSSFAKALAVEYKSNPGEKEWARLLARIILIREPRTRALFQSLSKPDAVMVFAGKKWFSGGLKNAFIEIGNGEKVYPFSDNRENGKNLSDSLAENSWWCLGEWRNSELLQDYDNCRLIGYKKEEISLHRIGQALRPPCEILHYLGVLKSAEGKCYLDHQIATEELGRDLASDFGWEASTHGETLSITPISFPETPMMILSRPAALLSKTMEKGTSSKNWRRNRQTRVPNIVIAHTQGLLFSKMVGKKQKFPGPLFPF